MGTGVSMRKTVFPKRYWVTVRFMCILWRKARPVAGGLFYMDVMYSGRKDVIVRGGNVVAELLIADDLTAVDKDDKTVIVIPAVVAVREVSYVGAPR